jgi:hypothetical protein
MARQSSTRGEGKNALEPTRIDNLKAQPLAAPIIYMDVVSAFGIQNGIVSLTLEAMTHHSEPDGKVLTARSEVAHLRLTPLAFQNFRQVVEKVALLAAPVSAKPV